MFGQSVEEEWLYHHPGFEEAMNRLLYVCEAGEALAVVMAEDGSGRTSLLKSVFEQRSRGGHQAVMVSTAACRQQTVLQQICRALMIDAPQSALPGELLLLIKDEVRGRELCGRHTAILLDDLHRADEDLYGILRFLSSINQQTGGALSLIAGTSADDRSVAVSESVLKIELRQLTEVQAVEFLATGLGLNGALDRVETDGLLAAVQLSKQNLGSLKRSCAVMLAALEADENLFLNAALVEALFEETLQQSSSYKAA